MTEPIVDPEGKIFRGGINVPRPRRMLWQHRANATIPLGRLLVTKDSLTLWAIGDLTALGSGTYQRVTIARSDVVVSRVYGVLRNGLAFCDKHGVSYFWTYRPKRVLHVLARYDYRMAEPLT